MKKLALHWQIIIGMILGTLAGVLMSAFGLTQFSSDWVKPFGKIFLNLLKLIAAPLVLVSLIQGVSSLSDLSKLSRMGTKTLGFYLGCTVVSISIGLLLVNIAKPGHSFSPEKRAEFQQQFASTAQQKTAAAANLQQTTPLQPLVDIVPENVFGALSDNKAMLQVILFAVLFGMAMVMVDPEVVAPLKGVINGINEAMIKMVQIIMYASPFGVFALLASLITDFAGEDPARAVELLAALSYYALIVVVGLLIVVFVFYGILIKVFTRFEFKKFLQGLAPAQIMAFTTSSSAATLPVTMDCVEKNLGVSRETMSFVLPLGATVNMNGTSLYQAVAAVFIAQVYGMDLSFGQQLGIVATATLAAVGSAAVPGAGMVMLVIVLEQAKIPVEGIAIIFAPDRLLDMCRTVVNMTGDAIVAVIVDDGEKQHRS